MQTNRFFRLVTTFAAAGAFMLVSHTAKAQSVADSDTLLLRGIVGAICTISVAANVGVNDNLDLSPTGAGNRVTNGVADVTEDCNNPAGYSVDASSANGGTLNGAISGGSQAYQLRYGGGSWTNLGATSTMATEAAAPGAPIVRSVDVRYNIPAALADDFYDDTVTFDLVIP